MRWLRIERHTLHELDKTEGTVQLHQCSTTTSSSAGALVLVPRPSPDDPNDPLRWSPLKKHTAFLSVCAFTFLANYGIGGLAPAFYQLSLEFDKSVAETSLLLIWPIFTFGFFNFVWVPLANYFGKRPIFVFCSALLCVSYMWGALASSFRSLLWSNIVAAFAGASTEALGAAIVSDLYFLHERGAKMGVYMNFIAGGNTLGPLVCGFIITGLSWRWHKWIAVILTGLNFVTVMLFVPETRYFRDGHVGDRDGNSDTDSSLMETAPAGIPSSSNPNTTSALDALRVKPSSADISDAEKSNLARPPREHLDVHSSSDNTPASRRWPAPSLIPKKTFFQELSLWSGTPPDTSLIKIWWRPVTMFAYPCTIFAFIGYAVSLVLVVAVNILNPFVLQAAPYSWSPMMNGLINIPGFIGNVLGAYAGGRLVDLFCDWRARQNGGVFEPESRLYLLILPLLITGAGILLFGYGVAHTLHWTSLFFAYGMISFALTAVPTATMAYVSDCLLPVNSDALMLVNGSKNIVAFWFLFGIIPWVAEDGYINTFGTLTGIFVGVIGIGMGIMVVYGAKIRHRQARWRIIL